MKKMSYLMLSGLIATCFLTVNCQKSPSKRGIKSRAGLEDVKLDLKTAEKSAQPDATKDTATTASGTATTEQLISQLCSDTSKNLIIEFKTLIDETAALINAKNVKSQSELETILVNRKSILEKCDVVLADISKYKGETCQIGAVGIKKEDIKGSCLTNGEALKEESQVENKFATLSEKEVADQKIKEQLMDSEFVISDDGKVILDENSLNFAKYISKGEISFTAEDLDKVIATKEMACSFSVADATDVQLGVETVLELKSIESETKAIPEDFKGKATSLNFLSVNADETKSPAVFNLVCLNIDSENLDSAKLKSTLRELIKIK